ncbi:MULTISPECIES: hypothetical protein [unclassified Microcoleus]|uniref:hypothetical protein n=1 Tax=unclassified Microcoleus TaxID=2642155 RepID=UPI002FD310D6
MRCRWPNRELGGAKRRDWELGEREAEGLGIGRSEAEGLGEREAEGWSIGRSEAEGLGIPHNAIEPLSVDPRGA